MIPREELTLWKKEIGLRLRSLRAIKRQPDNFTSSHVRGTRAGLSQALSGKAKVYRENPELKPHTECIQTRLKI